MTGEIDMNNIDISSRYESDMDEFDYLEMAESATTKKEKLECIEKALEIDPKNTDAMLMKAYLTIKNSLDYLNELDRIVEIAADELKKERYFDDCIGDFWGFVETRPYMSARFERINILISLGMIRLAEDECRDMLRLCTNDNLGIRYTLMHIYAFFEDEQEALKLNEKYPDESTMMLLPLSVLYYKKRDFKTASEYLQKLSKINKGLNNFLKAAKSKEKLTELMLDMSPYGYQYSAAEEFVEEFMTYHFLFVQVAEYFTWAQKELKAIRAKKS